MVPTVRISVNVITIVLAIQKLESVIANEDGPDQTVTKNALQGFLEITVWSLA